MDDRAGTGVDHRRHQRPVEAHGAQQVHIELVGPILFGESGESARRRAGAADDMDDDLRSSTRPDMVGNGFHPAGGGEVRGDEVVGLDYFGRSTRHGGDHGARLPQPRNNCGPSALRAARDDSTTPLQIHHASLPEIGQHKSVTHRAESSVSQEKLT